MRTAVIRCDVRLRLLVLCLFVKGKPVDGQRVPWYLPVMNVEKAKPALVHTILCDDVRQEVGGKFSLMGLFEGISAPLFPVTHPRFAIWNEWSGGRGEFTSRVRLLAPDRRTVISESETKFSLFSEGQRHRDISVRFNTPFTAPGTYWLEIALDGDAVSLVPLPVQQVSAQNVH